MQSWVVSGTKAEPSLVFMDLPMPIPGEGEVLIRIASAGVMPTELGWPSTWFQASGADRAHTIPSHEFSGTVETLGPNVSAIRAGDEVFGVNDWYTDGSMAEFCVAPVQDVAPKPRTVTHSEAASMPISALTAWQALSDHGRLQSGERVLIHGAAGSVGNFAVQLAKHHGAYVIATASAPNREFVTQLGADEVIDYHTEKFEQAAGLVDVVVDTVGGETLRRSWAVLGPRGRLITVASAERLSDERARNAFFIVEPNRDQLVRIASLIDDGSIKTYVKAVVTLSEAAREYLAPTKGPGHGKTVVRVRGE